jgi:hypothetical protein
MPLNVAVEQPYTRVVSGEAKDNIAFPVHKNSVSSHRDSRIAILSRVSKAKIPCVHFGPGNGLEVMAVEVERVLASVYTTMRIGEEIPKRALTVVIDHDLYDLIMT